MVKVQVAAESQSNSPTVRDQDGSTPAPEGVRFYEIHVKGHLDSKWSDWFDGMQMGLLDNGEMVLVGPIVDQAALMGLLNKLNRLNLTLLSVNKITKESHEKER